MTRMSASTVACALSGSGLVYRGDSCLFTSSGNTFCFPHWCVLNRHMNRHKINFPCELTKLTILVHCYKNISTIKIYTM